MHRLTRLLPVCLLFACSALFACQSPKTDETLTGSLHGLAKWMTGTFSSAEQAAQDPDEYFHIRLVMLPIWEQQAHGDERWLYVEQAAADSLDQPYRQRIYRLSQLGSNRFQSEVFELPGDPLRFAQAWKTPTLLAALKPEDLEKREGCAILLTGGEGVYIGRTKERSCPSTLRGAAWASSEVIVQADQLTSWDRGWDADGRQVWGATKAGYRFVKQSEGAPRVLGEGL